MDLDIIEVRKNYKFKGGYNIKGRVGVFFFNDIDFKNLINLNNGKVAVPYVFYSRRYKKHFQDLAYFSVEEFLKIWYKINNKRDINKLSILDVNKVQDEIFPIVTVLWADGLKIYNNLRIYNNGRFMVCDGITNCWETGKYNKEVEKTIRIYK